MKKILILILSLTGITSYSQNNDSLATKLTKEIEQIAKENLFIGFSVAIYNENGAVYTKGFGYADKEKKRNISKIPFKILGLFQKHLLL